MEVYISGRKEGRKGISAFDRRTGVSRESAEETLDTHPHDCVYLQLEVSSLYGLNLILVFHLLLPSLYLLVVGLVCFSFDFLFLCVLATIYFFIMNSLAVCCLLDSF